MTTGMFHALSRLARSSWGKQGIGACPNQTMRQLLIEAGYAKPVPGEKDKRILALTLEGFRAYQARVVDILISQGFDQSKLCRK